MMNTLHILFGRYKSRLAQYAKRQEEIIRIMAVLPGKYTYSQVEAALIASALSPSDIYLCIASGQHSIGLECFYGALGVNT
jgi:hypothetical protein